MMERTAVVIPARNEAATIARVVRDALDHFPLAVVVDDGSTDDTAHHAEDSGARLVRFRRGRGYGAAIAAGVAAVSTLDADNVLLMDGDGAHSASDGAYLVQRHMKNGSDLTIGSRFLVADPRIPSSKRAANAFATLLFNLVTGASVTDAASGLRVLHRTLFELVLQSGDDFGAAFTLLAKACGLGFRVLEAPTSVRYDARELFGTSQTELRQFLAFCIAKSGSRLGGTIAKLDDMIRTSPMVHLRIEEREFVLHRIEHCKAFVFQEQDIWFSSGRDGDVIIVS